jgi:rhamnose transport system ATP-binding protein
LNRFKIGEKLPASLKVQGAAKRFGGVKALVDANLELYPGEVHALLGENGAGKSTLLKTFAGVHKLDSGFIELFGEPFLPSNTKAALAGGIAVIYQEPSLFPDLTLAENVFVGRQPMRSGKIDWANMTTSASSY